MIYFIILLFYLMTSLKFVCQRFGVRFLSNFIKSGSSVGSIYQKLTFVFHFYDICALSPVSFFLLLCARVIKGLAVEYIEEIIHSACIS